MHKKTTVYIVLLLFCAQAVLAGIDVHTVNKDGSHVDFVHHYIDNHGNQSNCDNEWNEASANISFSDHLEYEQADHSENTHHGCSGHVTPLDYNNLSYIKPIYAPVKASFNYLTRFYFITPIPLIRPPIFF